MPRSSKRSSGRRSKKDNREKSSPSGSLLIEDVGSDLPMADRYYQLAETMNARGAIELAVPFYRQALALLLQERDQLNQLIPEEQQQQLKGTREEEIQGLIQEAAVLGEGGLESTPSLQEPSPSDLEERIAELAEELDAKTAEQVLVGLQALESDSDQLPASGRSLEGKALLLLGRADPSLASFEAAWRLDADAPEHAINLAAAYLTKGRAREAAALLQPLHQRGLAVLETKHRSALLRNFATAASKLEQFHLALQLRRQWLSLDPQAVPLERWLHWARLGCEQETGQPCRREALALLQDLHRIAPSERSVKEALAEALEAEGKYRQAALLYRDLLRP